MPMWLGAGVGVALITVGLRKDRFVLVVLAALILGYATFATLVYGASPWHIAFVPMLILMAFLLAEPQAPKWPVVIMLIPLFVQGIGGAIIYSRFPDRDESASFAAIVADAGDRLQPTENLVAWPEFIGSAAAARYDFSYLSGNTGDVVRVRDRRTARFKQMDIEFLMNHPGPYWLLCEMCDIVVTVIKASGRTVVPLHGPAVYRHDMYVGAFRVE